MTGTRRNISECGTLTLFYQKKKKRLILIHVCQTLQHVTILDYLDFAIFFFLKSIKMSIQRRKKHNRSNERRKLKREEALKELEVLEKNCQNLVIPNNFFK